MLEIGKVYLEHTPHQTRLCADISMNGRGTTLWFGVAPEQGAYLCHERSDAFVMALLPTAMRGGHDICFRTPMSLRLHYQLQQYLIPTLSSVGELYRPMSVRGPLTDEPVENRGAVATGFSGGVDSLYTIMTHGADSPYPLTHLVNFHAGVYDGLGGRKGFLKACSAAQRFADEIGLEFVAVDTNLSTALPERYLDVYSFRNLSCAMALQNLFSVYLLSDGRGAANFSFDLHNSDSYDLLTVSCAQTETMAVHLSGIQLRRRDKLEALSRWEPSYRWLHPCTAGLVGERNCGRCRKCTRDQVTLYALNALDAYGPVFDTADFRKRLPQSMGFLMAYRKSAQCRQTVDLLRERGIPIPPAAYIYEKQFLIAMENMEKQKRSEE